MVVCIEDVLHGLRRDLFDVRHGRAGAAGVIGIHDDEVVLHLDDDVIAMAILVEIALPEPDARDDLLDRFEPGIRSGGEYRHEGERDERAAQPDPLTHRSRVYMSRHTNGGTLAKRRCSNPPAHNGFLAPGLRGRSTSRRMVPGF